MDNQSKSLMIVGVVITLLVAGGIGFWYWSKSKQTLPSQTPEAPTLGSEIFEKTQNPIKGQVPDTNPFDDQPNPFGDKTNPIEKAYNNPF
ncbi:MAG: hypothetical protein G01um101444_259 [Parcubacteria group bacterium Gr01-1014_44]|nr:MAG: hypothetical protein G01um101444_259 [Parcubacteria group bacterium Gr01-1014_44]